MIKSCPSHSPHSGRPCGSQAPLPVPGGGWCPHRWADSRGDSPPATMAKSMEMGLSLFTRAPLCLPLLRPCLLPCLHPSSCFSHPSLQTHRHRLQSGRQLTLDRSFLFMCVFFKLEYLEVELLGHGVCTLWLLLDIARLFSKTWEFPFSYILVNTLYCQTWKTYQSDECERYIILP